MIVLQLEHPVPNFDGWKKAFESDPVGRRRGGVVRYSILKKLRILITLSLTLSLINWNKQKIFLDYLNNYGERLKAQ